MKSNAILTSAPPDFKWPRCPEAENFIRQNLNIFLKHHAFAKNLAEKMAKETSTDFIVWVDHLILSQSTVSVQKLEDCMGIIFFSDLKTPAGLKAFKHPYADLPAVLLSSEERPLSCAITVDSIEAFNAAHQLTFPIEGLPSATYRCMKIPGEKSDLYVIERRGTQNFVLETSAPSEDYLQAVKTWGERNRHFDDIHEGMNKTLALAEEMSKKLGSGLAAAAFLEAERNFWQSKNKAGQIQKKRQDSLGLGWANHDHHTFRSSRAAFPMLINILMAFGFKKRERFYAGAKSGWGAQVMEQPEAGLIIFADVDLTPNDLKIDFSSSPLPPLPKHNTVGLWCALHGESMLEAGLHHLEAQFDFDALEKALLQDKIKTMNPFTNWPHLKQAFTEGELWKVAPARLDKLINEKQISKEAYDQIKKTGAVGSHLENLHRREGFKGFNHEGVSQIIEQVNPEKQALEKWHEEK